MAIEAIHSYLVTPSKHTEECPEIGGTELLLSGRLFQMLAGVYDKSESECRIEIAFTPTDGKQQNNARDLLLQYLKSPSLSAGKAIAASLQNVTDMRPGLGLLFLIAGIEGKKHKLIVSRFPADAGVLAEQKPGGLSVKFIEHVFLKSATSYKAAVYVGSNLNTDFWDGRCIDKQVNNDFISVSDYWIKQFLASDFKTTPAQGTRRVAVAFKNALKATSDMGAKEEIAAAARLTSGLNGKAISAESLVDKYSLSQAAEEAFKKQFPPELYQEKFKLDGPEYAKHIAFQSIELSNGGILTAEAPKFDEVFQREEIRGLTRFTTEGTVVGERLRTSKP
jgi:hypothetical protein